jgi:ligand-binding sensor domain-containing protein/signal transduction histidine kinase
MRVAGSRKRVVPLFLALLLLTSARAERLPIKVYTSADGLPRDHISRIVQDSRGFLWFCTTEGLSRFDGYKFTNYGKDQGLAGRSVNDFLESRGGLFWVATDKGLCCFNPDPSPQPGNNAQPSRRFIFYYPNDEARARATNVILEDRAGAIWCGTDDGLFRFDETNGQWGFSLVDIIRPSAAAVRPAVIAITEDRQGSLWISAESGLHRRRPDGVVEFYPPSIGLPVQRALLEDRDGSIWAATHSGLYRLARDPKPDKPIVTRVYTAGDGLTDQVIVSLCQASNGRLLVGTSMGLSEFIPETVGAINEEGGRFHSYTQANGLSDKEIDAIAEDRDHNLWIGTPFGGVMRLAANGWTTYDLADGLGGASISTIIEDREGALIVGDGEAHLNRFDGMRFAAARLTLPRGISYWGWGWYQVTFQDSKGEWWMPSGEGLIRYPTITSLEQITSTTPKAIYTTRNGLPANDVFRLFEDSRGDIWISTIGTSNDALTRWERATETFHIYTLRDGIPENAAPTAFCEDASGNLWIGFYTGGLLRYSGGRFTAFNSADGVPQGFIRGIYLDHAGRLWAATGEGGVARVDDPAAEHPHIVAYSTAEGLSSNQATCVTEDKWGMIYVGTGRGLDKLDPLTGHIKHYTTADGLANSFINVALRHTDGSLWFGTLQGLSRLIPQPEPATQPPPILITGLRVAGLTYPLSELGAAKIAVPELAADQNNIEIEFAGLSFAVGGSLRYQYKLEGASSQWSPPTDQRTITYPNLAAGSYDFFVRAVSSDGTVSEAPASVSFRVLRPVWQRWWFVSMMLIIIALPLVAVTRYRRQRVRVVREAEEALRRSREERLVELEQVRRRIATDLHDDIGSSLSQIFLLSEVVRQRVGPDSTEVIEPLTMISSASNEMVSSMSDIVWAINPQKDHLRDLTHRMRRFASDTFATRDIAFKFSAPDDEADIRLGANIRREVFLVFKESVNNLVKHSACSEARVVFEIKDGFLLLRVSDNGTGFDFSADSDGHGLLSMRERASSIGGQFDLVSGKDRGTTITLRVQLPKPSDFPAAS